MEKNNITRLFEDFSLYEEKTFELYTQYDGDFSNIKYDNLKKLYAFLGLLNRKENLITDCLECGGRFPFTLELRNSYSSYSCRDDLTINVGTTCDAKGYKRSLYISFNECVNIENTYILNNSIEDDLLFLDYYFICSNNNNHMYKMTLMLTKHDNSLSVKKIGQYPDSTILGTFESEKYKNILRRMNDSYISYQNAEKSFKYGLYSGAYTYLRRVFENMIDFYLDKNNIPIQAKANSEDRINAVKPFFDNRIRDFLNPLYSALSKGIHKIKDQECKVYYNELKTIIDIQLQFIKSNDELEQKLDESSKALIELNTKYKGK